MKPIQGLVLMGGLLSGVVYAGEPSTRPQDTIGGLLGNAIGEKLAPDFAHLRETLRTLSLYCTVNKSWPKDASALWAFAAKGHEPDMSPFFKSLDFQLKDGRAVMIFQMQESPGVSSMSGQCSLGTLVPGTEPSK